MHILDLQELPVEKPRSGTEIQQNGSNLSLIEACGDSTVSLLTCW
ncbi:SapB/AmfS family lanthipeptide [Amycolatopsis anabasis]|nr:SapB/AmfS family lanthipeptide [Amycolatopsis anabasis]